MGFLSSIFGTDSAHFWRTRAVAFEKKLEESEKKRDSERERHRIREEFLLDEILKLAGARPFREKAERAADVNGFEAEYLQEVRRENRLAAAEFEEAEKRAFVEDCVRQGKTAEEAEKYFKENKAEILNGS